MEFFDNLVLPQSSEHIQLMHYILILILFLYVPFIGVIFGGSGLSLLYRMRGMRESNPEYLRFSSDVIEMITINKSVGVILGIVPLFTFVLIFSQLLHQSNIEAAAYLFLAFLLSSIGLILIYTYRFSSKFQDMLEAINSSELKDENLSEEIYRYKEGSLKLNKKSGLYGFILLFAALWLFISGVTLTTFSSLWDSDFFYVIFSWKILLRFAQFIAAALGVTGASLLFGFFYWEGGKEGLSETYKTFIRKIAIKITFTGALLQPFFIFINTIVLPDNALSTSVFTYSLITLLLLFLAYHFIYAMIKNSNEKFSGALFFVLLFALFALIIKDQMAMSNATKLQAVVLNARFEEHMKALRGPEAEAEISGKEIYDVRCSSCHRFDVKLVGPAYKDVMPKYDGKEDQLVGFILNPVKVDPKFPPMPNPALKPNEAKAVAKYLLEEYKK